MITRRAERGQAIVLVALMIVVLFGFAALAFDSGYAMADRRNLQAHADDAALAGTRSYLYGGSPATAHFVAMQYLAKPLGFALPVGSCSSASACPAGPYTASGYTVTLTDGSSNALDVSIQHRQPGIFSKLIGFGTLTSGAAARATPPGPQMVNAVYAVAAVSGDALINGGGAALQTVGGPVYAYGSFGANNVPHTTGIPTTQADYDGTACPGNPPNHVDNGGNGNNLNFGFSPSPSPENWGVPPPHMFDSSAPTLAQPAPIYTTTAQAKDASGNWKPGIYNGIFPSGGLMNPGVYKIVNVTSTIALGSITNATYTASGTADPNGAVALMLDNTDTGALDLSQAKLNGLDDLYPQNYTGSPRDPQGTHNFVIWGGNGATGYSGGVTIGPHAATDMSGIIYLPQSAYVSDGNASPLFTGSLIVASMTVHGGGNGQQLFHWVCGLNSVSGSAYQGGLVR